jgi:uncharacterized damage-inducible protein DinB
MKQALLSLFDRDIQRLHDEIALYTVPADLWKLDGDISNTAGNLAIHLCGSLNHFIGAVLGNTGYVRTRDAEFAVKDVPQEEILQRIRDMKQTVLSTLEQLPEEDLEKTYPLEVFGHPMTTGYFLIHITGHLNYHLGQINYHRRLL